MILATHALTGAVIGKNVESPFLVIIISFIVHYLMDSLRHGEYFDSRFAKLKDTWWRVALDLSIPIITLSTFAYFENPGPLEMRNILLGSFFSMLPDGFTLIFWKYPRNSLLSQIKKFHETFHRYGRFPKFSPERQWTFRNAWNDIWISLLAIIILFFC